jgi:hypothetical protein
MAYIINFLLTEREVFFVQTEPVGRGLYKKTEVRYFSVIYRASEVNKKFIIHNLYAFILETNKKCMIWNAH